MSDSDDELPMQATDLSGAELQHEVRPFQRRAVVGHSVLPRILCVCFTGPGGGEVSVAPGPQNSRYSRTPRGTHRPSLLPHTLPLPLLQLAKWNLPSSGFPKDDCKNLQKKLDQDFIEKKEERDRTREERRRAKREAELAAQREREAEKLLREEKIEVDGDSELQVRRISGL